MRFALGGRRQAQRAVRPRRGAGRPLAGGRADRRLHPGDGRLVARVRLHETDAPGKPERRSSPLFWAGAIGLVAFLRFVARSICKRHASYHRTWSSSAPARSASSSRASSGSIRSTASTSLGFVDARLARHGDYGLGTPTVLGPPGRPAAARRRPRRRPRHLRVLRRATTIGLDSSASSERRRPGRHRPTLLRRDRADWTSTASKGCRARPPAFRLVALGAAPQANRGHRGPGLVLLVLAPLFIVIALLIKLDSRGPGVLPPGANGRGERTFRIWKFRTMVADADERKHEVVHLNQHRGADARMFKAPNDPRMTRVGRDLRRFSLDELPAAHQRAARRDEPGRPAAADARRGPARRRVGAQAARPAAGDHRPVAGARRHEIPFDEMIGLDYRYVAGGR